MIHSNGFLFAFLLTMAVSLAVSTDGRRISAIIYNSTVAMLTTRNVKARCWS